MNYWSAAFLLIALAAGVMGASGIAGVPGQTASGLFLAALLLALFPAVLRQRQEAPPQPRDNERRD